MRLLVYIDGQPSSAKALRFAAELTRKLDADLAVIMVRSGTSAIETHPPFGQPVDLSDTQHFPPGLQVMGQALDILLTEGLFAHQNTVQLQERSNGYMFDCLDKRGKRIAFYICFGHMVEVLNHEIDRHHYDLLIVSPPDRSRLRKMVLGDTVRKLLHDIHVSLLFVRGGQAGSRFMVCADGSPSSARQFPMLKQILPALDQLLELAWVQTPGSDADAVQKAHHCLAQAERWLAGCGKQIRLLRLEGAQPAEIIVSTAGEDAVIMLGASLRHDIYRRLMGSLSQQVLALTKASVMVVKGLPEGDSNILEDPVTCE